MTTASGDPGGKPMVRWVAHRGVPLLLAAATVQATSTVMKLLVTGVAGELVSTALWAAAAGILLLLLVSGRRHDRMVCLDCARNVPLDPQCAVQRHHAALVFAHWSRSRRGAVCALVLCAVTVALQWTLPYPASGFAMLILWTVLTLHTWGFSRHRVLHPWCPYCRWGDGGGEEPSPEPVPPTGERAFRV